MNAASNTLIGRWVSRYVDVAFHKPLYLLVGYIALGVISGLYAAHTLRVETDLKALLPEDTKSVAALNESRRRIGSTDFFVIAIKSGANDRRAIALVQDRLKTEMETAWAKEVRWVQIGRDTSFFKDHALYYFEEEKLIELKALLEEEIVKATAESLPGMVSLLDDDNEDPPSAIRAWLDPKTIESLGLPPQIESELTQTLTSESEDDAAGGSNGKGENLGDRLIGPQNDVGVVLAQLRRPSTDLDYARFALEEGERLIHRVLEETGYPDIEAQVVGAYRSFLEVDVIKQDGRIATGISVALVLLMLWVFFRSARAPLALFMPLAVTGAVTMGLTAAVYGRLTVLTLFVLAMLAGMGIDYAIHLFGRIKTEIGKGRIAKDAVFRTLLDTGAAVITAGLTTVGAMATLLTGHFSGFHEFAVVATVGIALAVVLTLLMTPPLIALLNKRRAVLLNSTETNRRCAIPTKRFERWLTALFITGVAVTAMLVPFVPRVAFENNFRNLRGPKTQPSIKYGRAIGKKASTTPAIILGDSREEMAEVHAFLKERLDDPRISSFITAETLAPAMTAQTRRAPIIKEIGLLAGKKALKRTKGDSRRLVALLEKLGRAAPFKDTELPEWARNMLTEQNGTFGHIGHLYARIKDWDASSVKAFQDVYGSIDINGRAIPIANSVFVLSDVVKMVKADGRQLLIATLIVLVTILAIFSRSVKGTLILTTSVAAGLIWTVGLMGLFQIKVGLYNVIVIPVILGVSIDTAVHLYHRHQTLGRKGLKENLRTTGVMVAAGALTTVAGFTGLLFVSHMGLRSIGLLACVGITACLFAMLTILPFLLMRSGATSGSPVDKNAAYVIPKPSQQEMVL